MEEETAAVEEEEAEAEAGKLIPALLLVIPTRDDCC